MEHLRLSYLLIWVNQFPPSGHRAKMCIPCTYHVHTMCTLWQWDWLSKNSITKLPAHESIFGILKFKICCLQIYSLKYKIPSVKTDNLCCLLIFKSLVLKIHSIWPIFSLLEVALWQWDNFLDVIYIFALMNYVNTVMICVLRVILPNALSVFIE